MARKGKNRRRKPAKKGKPKLRKRRKPYTGVVADPCPTCGHRRLPPVQDESINW